MKPLDEYRKTHKDFPLVFAVVGEWDDFNQFLHQQVYELEKAGRLALTCEDTASHHSVNERKVELADAILVVNANGEITWRMALLIALAGAGGRAVQFMIYTGEFKDNPILNEKSWGYLDKAFEPYGITVLRPTTDCPRIMLSRKMKVEAKPKGEGNGDIHPN